MSSIIWKTIKRFPDYMISNTGQVLHIKSNKIIDDNFIIRGNYYSIFLKGNGRTEEWPIHELVIKNFSKLNPKNCGIEHINKNTFDNNINNLRYNIFLTPVMQLTNRHEIIKRYSTIIEAEKNGFSKGNILKCCLANNNLSYQGFQWEFIK